MPLRQDRIDNELADVRELPFAQVIECSPNGIERTDLWILWIPGKQSSLFHGGQYPVTISFPKEYPRVGPKITFPPEFKHVHVYQNGSICMPLLEAEYWKPKTSMPDILQRVIPLIHQEVNPYSPANAGLFKLYREDKEEYDAVIQKQSENYRNQDVKYFQHPGIHIKILPI